MGPRKAELGTLKASLTLARWLGPWAREATAPDAVERTRLPVRPDGERAAFDMSIYLPRGRASTRTIVVAPGLQHAGPDDPRVDRFCRILAASGAAVAAPFIPDFVSLRLTPAAVGDFARAFDAVRSTALAPPERPPIVFSISFGSLLALRLAAGRPARQIARLVLFGGYVDLADAIDFCLGGGGERVAHDPLNRPVVFINLVDHIDTAHREQLVATWRRYIETTWGRAEMKDRRRWEPIARAFAAGLPPAARGLFLAGCGAEPGGDAIAHAALARLDTRFLDPRPHLSRVRCPVDVVHGVDDDVIPYRQAEILARGIPHARLHGTGLYGHTGRTRVSPRALARELTTLARLLALLAR
jgi:pimeloyl-ACP methyl ester carboxylesterase